MLPSLTVAFIAGLLIGSQIPYFPLSASFLLFLAGLGALSSNDQSVLRSQGDMALRSALSWSRLLGGSR